MWTSIKRILGGLSVTAIVVLAVAGIWLGSDLWTFLRDGGPDVDTSYSLRPARALKNAQERAVKAPDIVYVSVVTPAEDQAIRDRHGVGRRVVDPKPDHTAPLADPSNPLNGPQDAPGGSETAAVYPLRLDLRDLEIGCSGVTYEVGCWLDETGRGRITISERPKEKGEKAAEVLKSGWARFKDAFDLENAIDIQVMAEPADWANTWEITAGYEPLRIARGHARAQVRYDGATSDTEFKVGYRTRFTVGRKK